MPTVKTVGTTEAPAPDRGAPDRSPALARASRSTPRRSRAASVCIPNGVRTQLQRLSRAGLVAREAAHGEVGRPRTLWRVTPQAIAEADLPHTGWAMARSLARAIPATPARLREVEAAGVDLGVELAADLGARAPAGATTGSITRSRRSGSPRTASTTAR